MDVYLNLIALKGPEDLQREVIVENSLTVRPDWKIFEQILSPGGIKTTVTPEEFLLKRPSLETLWEITATRRDAFGRELTFSWAKDLRNLEWPEDTSPINPAIKAFIEALPDNIPIILFWC